MPSFHALRSRTESSRHCSLIIMASKQHRCASIPHVPGATSRLRRSLVLRRHDGTDSGTNDASKRPLRAIAFGDSRCRPCQDRARPHPQASLVRRKSVTPDSSLPRSTHAAARPIGWTHDHHLASQATALHPPLHPHVGEGSRATTVTSGDIGIYSRKRSSPPQHAEVARNELLTRTFVGGAPRKR